MPPFGPISRRDLIAALRLAGFEGPRPGAKHAVMIRGRRYLRIPNPHRADLSKDLLSRLLREAGLSREEWENL